MNRRGFLTALGGVGLTIIVPKYGRLYRPRSWHVLPDIYPKPMQYRIGFTISNEILMDDTYRIYDRLFSGMKREVDLLTNTIHYTYK
jgi:hypothetical protein